MKFHGHVFSHDGLKTDTEKDKAIVFFTSFPFFVNSVTAELVHRPYFLEQKACWCSCISYFNFIDRNPGRILRSGFIDLSGMILLMSVSTRLLYSWSFSSPMGWLMTHCQSILAKYCLRRALLVSHISNWMLFSMCWLVTLSFGFTVIVWSSEGPNGDKFSRIEN